jgi:hypothetical protein
MGLCEFVLRVRLVIGLLKFSMLEVHFSFRIKNHEYGIHFL